MGIESFDKEFFDKLYQRLPQHGTGVKLPDPKTVTDYSEFVLVNGTTKKLYKMFQGNWYLIKEL